MHAVQEWSLDQEQYVARIQAFVDELKQLPIAIVTDTSPTSSTMRCGLLRAAAASVRVARWLTGLEKPASIVGCPVPGHKAEPCNACRWRHEGQALQLHGAVCRCCTPLLADTVCGVPAAGACH